MPRRYSLIAIWTACCLPATTTAAAAPLPTPATTAPVTQPASITTPVNSEEVTSKTPASPDSDAASQPAAVAEPEQPDDAPIRIAIPQMNTAGLDPAMAETLTDVLLVEANKVEGIEAIGMADIQAVLDHEQQRQLLACGDTSCLAEIGGAIGVSAILSSKVGKVGDTYMVTLRIVDTAEVKVMGSAQESVTGRTDALVIATREAAGKLLRPFAEGESVFVQGHREAPVEQVAAAQPEEEGGVVWPALGLGVCGGGACLSVGGCFGFTAYWTLLTLFDNAQVVGDRWYWPPGSGRDLATAKGGEYIFIGATTVGLLAVGAAITWQVLAGGGDSQ